MNNDIYEITPAFDSISDASDWYLHLFGFNSIEEHNRTKVDFEEGIKYAAEWHTLEEIPMKNKAVILKYNNLDNRIVYKVIIFRNVQELLSSIHERIHTNSILWRYIEFIDTRINCDKCKASKYCDTTVSSIKLCSRTQ
jgi:hypothetical protein